MCEMIACGKALVSTNVSGATAMIREGLNGFILKERDPDLYANAVLKAMALPDAGKHSMEIAEKYTLQYLARDIGALWQPLKQ